MSDGSLPACHRNNTADDFRQASPIDLAGGQPCRYCFRDAGSVGEIDRPLAQLVVSVGPGTGIHVHQDYGEPTYDPARSQAELVSTIAAEDFGPEDLGLSPVGGGVEE